MTVLPVHQEGGSALQRSSPGVPLFGFAPDTEGPQPPSSRAGLLSVSPGINFLLKFWHMAVSNLLLYDSVCSVTWFL